MVWVVALVAMGWGIGWLFQNQPRARVWVDRLLQGAVLLLLAVLGFQLGTEESVVRALPRWGGLAFSLSLAATAGSVACAALVVQWGARFLPVASRVRAQQAHQRAPSWEIALLLGVFFLGAVAGYGLLATGRVVALPGGLVVGTLAVLLFAVGLSLGADVSVWRALRQLGWRALLLPVATVAGSLVGVALLAFVVGVPLGRALAVGSGFGYYSLSSVIIGQLVGPEWGAVALLANVFREVMTILFAPLLVRLSPAALVSAGGATTMDTTLPLITLVAGKEWGLVALGHGLVLTTLVPFLVGWWVG